MFKYGSIATIKVVKCTMHVDLNWISLSFPFAGAQIIDFMVLVVDITKGIQTQTAEVHIYYITVEYVVSGAYEALISSWW